jgi:hypothetical protein
VRRSQYLPVLEPHDAKERPPYAGEKPVIHTAVFLPGSATLAASAALLSSRSVSDTVVKKKDPGGGGCIGAHESRGKKVVKCPLQASHLL